MKLIFPRINRAVLILLMIYLSIPLSIFGFWFSLTYRVQECLPIGDSDSDSFAQGNLSSSNVEKITVYFNKEEASNMDCKKIKALPKIEIFDKSLISKLNRTLSQKCYSINCSSKKESLTRTYSGYIIADLNSKKSVYLAFIIWEHRNTLIEYASRSFEIAANQAILGEEFCNLILADLQKLEKNQAP
jgi:hypothetical protein